MKSRLVTGIGGLRPISSKFVLMKEKQEEKKAFEMNINVLLINMLAGLAVGIILGICLI